MGPWEVGTDIQEEVPGPAGMENPLLLPNTVSKGTNGMFLNGHHRNKNAQHVNVVNAVEMSAVLVCFPLL